MIGLLYFLIIVIANTVGAISGMGGGVLIKPMLDLIHTHSAIEISFYSSVAVLTMSIVSTMKQIKNGISIDLFFAIEVSLGAVLGGFLGNLLFGKLLLLFPSGREVQLIQISLTIIMLLFSYLYSKKLWKNHNFNSITLKFSSGLFLGFLASLLGIGGGPINVALLMLLFNLPIKEATVYSIVTIFFSQLSKVLNIIMTLEVEKYDMSMFYYVIPAAVIGGFLGAYLSHAISEDKVNLIYQFIILLVLSINIYNGWRVF